MEATLLQHLEALSANCAHADVVLVARTEDGAAEELLCHSYLLERCPVFQRMLAQPFLEGATKRIEIPVIAAKHLGAVRHYLYTDKLDLSGGDWSADDVVEVMALCDKYGMPPALQAALGELAAKLDSLELPEAEQVVERLSVALGQEGPVRKALGELLSKVSFGASTLRHLIWLRRLWQCTSLSLDEEQEAVLGKVRLSYNAAEECHGSLLRELATAPAGPDEVEVLQARMLLTGAFLDQTIYLMTLVRMLQELVETPTESVQIGHLRELQPLIGNLEKGVGTLTKDLRTCFAVPARHAASSPEGAGAKRQRV